MKPRFRIYLVGAMIILVGAPVYLAITGSIPEFYAPSLPATVLIRFNPNTIDWFADRLDRPTEIEWQDYVDYHKELFFADHLLTNALKKDGIHDLEIIKKQSEPVQWLKGMIHVDFPSKNLMRVTFGKKRTQDSLKLLDAIVMTFYDEVVVMEENDKLRNVDSLERAANEAESRARTKRAELRNVTDLLGIDESIDTVAIAERAAIETMVLQQKLRTSKNRLATAKKELEKLEARHGSVPEAEIEAEIDRESDMFHKACQQRLAEQLITETSLDDPADQAIVKHLTRMGAVAKLLDAHRTELRPNIAARLLKQRTATLKSTVASLEQEIEETTYDLKAVTATAEKKRRSSIDIDMLSQEVQLLDEVANKMNRTLEHAKINLKSAPKIVLLGPAN